MNKKIFICGKVYELTAGNQTAIEKKIQKQVDKMTIDPDGYSSERIITFKMNVNSLANNTDADIEFIFERNNFFAHYGINPELINDSDAMIAMGMNGKFRPAVMWQFVEYFAPSRYNIPLLEFVPAYAGTADKLGASKVMGMEINSTESEFKLKIRV